MATLRIYISVLRGELIATQYNLEGVDPTGHADVYYNLAGATGSLEHLLNCKIYGIRKINFSTMVAGTTKNFQTNHSKGTITYYKNPSLSIDTANSNTLRCIGLNCKYLINCGELINQASRKKLPHYMLANDLVQLNENVQFDAIWGDNLKNYHREASTQGKFVAIVLNLFTTT
jgi:hypothetical protein